MHQRFGDSPEFIRGRAAERQIAAWLKPRGWFIFPACDYNGPNGAKAPKIQGARREIVVPDFGMARAGRWGWAEVKAKWDANYFRAGGTMDHGIGRRKYDHYRAFQDKVGTDVWLFILEVRYQRLRFERLNYLDRAIRFSNTKKMDRGGMVFWPREAFMCVVLDELPGLFDPDIPLEFEK